MNINIILDAVSTTSESKDGRHWQACRPMTAENTFLPQRIRAAWRVLMGKSDAVEWCIEGAAQGAKP